MGFQAFKTGQYVNTADGFTGYIYEDNGSNYQIAICERDEERNVLASELTLYTPKTDQPLEPIWGN
jgi:hypothetical protein